MISDERIQRLAEQHIAPTFNKMFPDGSYAETEQCKRAVAFARAVLAEAADQHRLEGWQAAREMANELAEREVRDANTRAVPSAAGGASMVMHTIRAMQPPSEWGGAQNSQNSAESRVVTGNEVVTDWPHPDGFAGGLTERRIDDGEGEESKKAT